VRARIRNEAAYYVALARLFSMSGRWYLPRRERLRIYYSGDRHKVARRDWGTTDQPARPPDGMTTAQIAKAKAYLELRGWTLAQNSSGAWQPQRTI
jgi:hypothetical protein